MTRIGRQHREGTLEAKKQKHISGRARKLRFIRHIPKWQTSTKEQTAMGFQVTPDQTAEQPAKLGTLNFHEQIV